MPGRIDDDAVALRRVDRPGERALVVVPLSVGGDGRGPIQSDLAAPQEPAKRNEPVSLDHVSQRAVEHDLIEHVAQADFIGPAAGRRGAEQESVLARRLPVLRKKPEVMEHGKVRLRHGPVRLVHGHEGPLLRPAAGKAIGSRERLNRCDDGQIAKAGAARRTLQACAPIRPLAAQRAERLVQQFFPVGDIHHPGIADEFRHAGNE